MRVRGATTEQIQEVNQTSYIIQIQQAEHSKKSFVNWIYTTRTKQDENINTIANRLVAENEELNII